MNDSPIQKRIKPDHFILILEKRKNKNSDIMCKWTGVNGFLRYFYRML